MEIYNLALFVTAPSFFMVEPCLKKIFFFWRIDILVSHKEAKEVLKVMRNIQVDPAVLEAVAAKIENATNDYVKQFSQLFNEVDVMANGWSGKDNLAFSNQIHGFEPDFRTISTLCMQYADFLKTSARS